MVLLAVVACCAGAAEVFVAPDGADANDGTAEKPFATLERARDEVRALKTAGKAAGGATVWLRGGVYSLSVTFKLTAGDSGTKEAPVVYRGVDGADVRLIGGKQIPADAFKPVEDAEVIKRLDEAARGKVLQADLKALGVTDYGALRARGFGGGGGCAALELFFLDRPMTLARYPNEGWMRIAAAPAGQNGGKFTYKDERPKRWAQADDIWLHGYWTFDWADSYTKVAAIDAEKMEVATKPPHGTYGYTPGKRFYALNILDELDAPGEWYVDRKSGILYFWPPKPLTESKAFVSVMDKPLVSLENASFVTLRGLTLECVRGEALQIKGGASNLVAACTLRNIGTSAISVQGGQENGVTGCEVYETGESGINLSGGDRKTLTSCGNFATNNHIHHYSRWCKTYRPGVGVHGVGCRVANNLIHDAPHNGILMGGNENVVEFNEIHHVCTETGDAGAFYIGRDWTQRGNIVRYNYFHHLDGVQGQKGFTEVMAVYLDDCASGTTVYGNVCYKVKRAMMSGGGRDNIIENNVFVDCPIAIHVDARATGWAAKHAKLEGGDWGMKKKLEDMKWNQPPYSTKYPKLATMLDEEPYMPKGTAVVRNVAFNCKQWLHLQDKLNDQKITIADNFTTGDPLFVDAEKQNFQFKEDSPVWKLGFKKIPLEKIGLQKDEYRMRLVGKE
jgi:hypothetical protein